MRGESQREEMEGNEWLGQDDNTDREVEVFLGPTLRFSFSRSLSVTAEVPRFKSCVSSPASSVESSSSLQSSFSLFVGVNFPTQRWNFIVFWKPKVGFERASCVRDETKGWSQSFTPSYESVFYSPGALFCSTPNFFFPSAFVSAGEYLRREGFANKKQNWQGNKELKRTQTTEPGSAEAKCVRRYECTRGELSPSFNGLWSQNQTSLHSFGSNNDDNVHFSYMRNTSEWLTVGHWNKRQTNTARTLSGKRNTDE